MKERGCPYRSGRHGRSFSTRPGVGSPTTQAHVQCSRCPKKASVPCRSDQTPRQLDAKFHRIGWQLDPNICVDCQRQASEEKEKPMATKPSTAAMKAQGQMFQLLTAHFDVEAGTFAPGWSDAKIAKDTGLAPDLVVEFRRNCFGDLKEPAAVASLRSDITALERLQAEQHALMGQEIAALRGQLAKVSAQFAA